MSPNEYQKLALITEKTRSFINIRFSTSPDDEGTLVPDHQLSRLMHGAIGVGTEAGELQDMLKKAVIYGKPLDLTNVLEEAGDLLWYIALALDAAGFTMEEAMERNIAKLKARYPAGFTQEAALNRDLDAERKVLETPLMGSITAGTVTVIEGGVVGTVKM